MSAFDALLAQVNGPPTPIQAFNFLLSSCSTKVNIHAYQGANEGYDSTLRPVECESLGQLLSSLSERVRLTDASIDTITIMFAAAISLEVSGPFIWMHITGASSSLKTTILELIGAAYDRVFSVTNFTSFYSGSTANQRDNSLLPQIQGKCFVIKDLTPLLQASAEVQNKIFPELRDIYDGNGSKFFNNGVNLEYKGVRFVCLTGVTYEIHNFVRTDMGERFLVCHIDASWSQNGECIRMATDMAADGNAYDSVFDTISEGFVSPDAPKLDSLETQRCMAWGFLNHLFEYMVDESHGLKAVAAEFKADRSFKGWVDGLAEWLEHARCKLPPKSAQANVRPVPALPHRSVKVLSKLAICLAIVTKSTGPTDEIRRLVRKVAFDSGFSFNLEIMNIIACHPNLAKNLLAETVKMTPTYVTSICDHLAQIGVVERQIVANSTGKGQANISWILTPKFRAIADVIGLKEHHLKRTLRPADTPAEALAKLFPAMAKKPVFGGGKSA